jgi:hypothetical protein
MLIDSFMRQTDARWLVHVIHDGPASEEIKKVISLYSETGKVDYHETSERIGGFGHSNRKMMLEKIEGQYDDYVLMTNDDNQYVARFVEYFLGECMADVGMVYCNTIHNYLQYEILYTEIKENKIDMGSFIVRMDVAKKVGFKHNHVSADGAYAEECARECGRTGLRTVRIPKALFIHN